MSIELNLVNPVLLGCQKVLAYTKFRQALKVGQIEAAISFATWNFALDDQLMQGASAELQKEIRAAIAAGGEGDKP